MKSMNESDWEKIWKSNRISAVDPIWRAVMWLDYRNILNRLSINENCNIIEVGSGLGLNSFRIYKKFGCNITLLDSCDIAIKKSKNTLNDKKIKFLKKNFMNLNNKKYINKYDLVFSEGLIEHFFGSKREKVIKKHAKLAKKGGHVILLSPRSSKRYSIIRGILESLNLWRYSEETFSEKEIVNKMKSSGLRNIKIEKPMFGMWVAAIGQKL